MGDMAYVVRNVPRCDRSYLFRFGGGFDFLRYGDNKGIWHSLESGLECVLLQSLVRSASDNRTQSLDKFR